MKNVVQKGRSTMRQQGFLLILALVSFAGCTASDSGTPAASEDGGAGAGSTDDGSDDSSGNIAGSETDADSDGAETDGDVDSGEEDGDEDIGNLDLGSFEITSIANGTPVALPLTIGWSESKNATSYRLAIAKSSSTDCSDDVVVQSEINSGLVFSLGEIPNGSYRVCLAAANDDSEKNAENNGDVSFSVQEPLGAFSIQSAATFTVDSPSLSWDQSAYATKYRVSVGANSLCDPAIQSLTIPSTALTAQLAPLGDGDYYACIGSEDDASTSAVAINSPFQFSIDSTPPGAFSISAPTGLQSDSAPTASWSAASDATKYTLKVSKVSDCATTVRVIEDVTGVTAPLGWLDDGEYYLCATASDAVGNEAPASASSSFTIKSWSLIGAEETIPSSIFSSWTPYYVLAGTKLIAWYSTTIGTRLSVGYSFDTGTSQWTKISSVNAPPMVDNFSIVWTGSKVIVWGGETGVPASPETNAGFAYDPATDAWTSISTVGAPTARYGHSAVWTGSKMIVWGGQYKCIGLTPCYRGDGAVYDPTSNTWSAMSATNAPPGRVSHTATWTGSKMVIFGGYQVFGQNVSYVGIGKSYSPTTNTWSNINGVGAPIGRAHHSAVWSGSKVIVWGGKTNTAQTYRNDGASYDPVGDTWTPVAALDAPGVRGNHRAVWTGTEMLVWGGDNDSRPLQDGGRYDPVADTWTSTSLVGAPNARQWPALVWTGSKALVWGGFTQSASTFFSSGRAYDPGDDTWSPITPAALQDPRAFHSAVWTGSEMLIWGGSIGSHLPNSGARFDPALNTWTETSQADGPTGRYLHSTVWTGSEMIVWGGRGISAGTEPEDGGIYNPTTDSWAPVSTLGAPEKRYSHRSVWTGQKMFVFGGEKRNTVTNSYDLFDDAFLYNKATDTWTSASAAPLSARRDVGMVWTGSEIIVWGGKSATATEKDGAKYDPITDIWTTINTANAPTLSVGFSSVWTGSKLLVWGKKNGTNVNAGGIYDLALDQWTLMSEVGQPTIERTNHTAVWTGSKMLIWGGASPGSENFVSIFDPSTNSWSQISGQFAPPARVSDAAVWTGTDLIVWGGIYGGKWLNAGGMLRFP